MKGKPTRAYGKEKGMEQRRLKLIARHPGGNASRGCYGFKLSVPTAWVYALGMTAEECEVIVSLDADGKRIIIESAKLSYNGL